MERHHLRIASLLRQRQGHPLRREPRTQGRGRRNSFRMGRRSYVQQLLPMSPGRRRKMACPNQRHWTRIRGYMVLHQTALQEGVRYQNERNESLQNHEGHEHEALRNAHTIHGKNQ